MTRLVFENVRWIDGKAGGLVVEDGVIVHIGSVGHEPGAIDGGGALLMPGLVNAHTHLYSALACGMPAPAKTPRNFVEILEEIWWKLDRALDPESLRLSALVGGLEALRSGVTTVFDHHASPSFIDGSLDVIRTALGEVGVRGSLCYEVTDRGGEAKRDAGIAENAAAGDFLGGHASFTLSDETLAAMAAVDKPFHIHVAEDRADLEPGDPIARYLSAGLLRPGSIVAHGVHLDAEALSRAADAGAWLVHNPRSNMNNQVGYAALAAGYPRLAVGTDGIGSDMLSEIKTAFFQARDMGMATAWDLPGKLIAGNAKLGGRRGWGVGSPADLVLPDYVPATPLHEGNFAGHLVFGLDRSYVRRVYVDGQQMWPTSLDTSRIYREAEAAAAALWERMGALS